MKTLSRNSESIRRVEAALAALRIARADLVAAGAGRSAAKVRRAIKSSEGPLRHAQGVAARIGGSR